MSERSNCPDPLDQENFQDEMPRDVPNCLPSVLATQTGTATDSCQQSITHSLPTAMNMSGPGPCASNTPPPTSKSITCWNTSRIDQGKALFICSRCCGVDFYRIPIKHPGKDRQQCLCLHCPNHGEDMDQGKSTLAKR